ncbi:MAG: transcription antitermination factor NusB [Calditrichales bacterium]|nr:MAG: transcription antitermination factor NusB [Calditrichales bacterium]
MTNKSGVKRTEERDFAFKMLYAGEFNLDSWRLRIEHSDANPALKSTEYVQKIALVYEEHKEEFDALISNKLKNWDLKRVAVIDKVILRLALAEIYYFDEIPPEVSINEAIELGKKYSTERSGKFINGVLDAIYQSLDKKK